MRQCKPSYIFVKIMFYENKVIFKIQFMQFNINSKAVGIGFISFYMNLLRKKLYSLPEGLSESFIIS